MKKIMFTLMALSLVMAVVLSSVTVVSAADVVYGDVNGDGKVNNRDLGLLQQYLNDRNPAGFNLEAADVKYDGKVNNRDLGLLQQYLNDYDVTLGPDEPVVPGPDDDDNRFNDTTLDWT